jgi:transporter family protein
VVFAWLMVIVVGSQKTVGDLSGENVVFLVLSGLATGGSWLCYFRALQIGDVNKVVPVDKSSTVLTMLMAFAFLGETPTPVMIVGMVAIGTGTYLMIEKQKQVEGGAKSGYFWLLYAGGSAIFAALTAILGKVGITGVEPNLGTAIRTVVVLILAWAIVLWQGKHREIGKVDSKSWVFLGLSGLATGLSWLCFYSALAQGPASIVVPIDKLSILLTVGFGWVFLKERLSVKSGIGLLLVVAGTLSLLI